MFGLGLLSGPNRRFDDLVKVMNDFLDLIDELRNQMVENRKVDIIHGYDLVFLSVCSTPACAGHS